MKTERQRLRLSVKELQKSSILLSVCTSWLKPKWWVYICATTLCDSTVEAEFTLKDRIHEPATPQIVKNKQIVLFPENIE